MEPNRSWMMGSTYCGTFRGMDDSRIVQLSTRQILLRILVRSRAWKLSEINLFRKQLDFTGAE